MAWIITSEVLKRFTKIFIKTIFNKNNPKCFCWKSIFNRLNFQNNRLNVTVISVTIEIQLWLLQLKLWLGQTNGQIKSIEWFVQLIEFWQLSSFLKTDFGYLKEWESSLSVLSKQSLSKSIPWVLLREILPLLCDYHFCKAFLIKKPPRTWIFEASLKGGSCYFGSGPKLSLLHLIFILCNLFCVEAFCFLL